MTSTTRPSRPGASSGSRRSAFLIALLAALALLVTACGGGEDAADESGEDTAEDQDEDTAEEPEEDGADEAGAEDSEDWPTEDIRFVIPAAAGGGFDGAARNIEPFWEEELGTTLQVDNQEGANFAIGAQVVADEGQDCNTIMFHAVPHLPFSYLAQGQEVDYTYDDFHPVGPVQIQPGVVVVADDSPFETFEDLVAEAEANPGEVSASVSGLANNNYLALRQMEDLLGIELNIVGYDGGGPAREAVVAGEVDMTHAAAFAALGIADESRVLAVHQEENEWPGITDDAPTLNEITGEDFGSNQSYYGVFVHNDCYEEYPERYETLESTFQDVLNNPDYQAQLEELDELAGLMEESAEEYNELVEQEVQRVEEAVEEDPDL